MSAVFIVFRRTDVPRAVDTANKKSVSTRAYMTEAMMDGGITAKRYTSRSQTSGARQEAVCRGRWSVNEQRVSYRNIYLLYSLFLESSASLSSYSTVSLYLADENVAEHSKGLPFLGERFKVPGHVVRP